MRIALVLMPWCQREHPMPELALTVALLKKENHDVFIFDINNDMFNNSFTKRTYWKYITLDSASDVNDKFFLETRDLFEYFSSRILSINPDIIIFKTMCNSTYSNSIPMARILKEKNRKKIIIFTEILATTEEDVETYVRLQKELPVDFIICGEDEIALPRLVEALEKHDEHLLNSFKRQGNVIDCLKGPIVENLDTLPFFDFSEFALDSYKFPEKCGIFTSKGCPWRCSFCMDWKTQNKYRSMSGDRIFQEVLHQLELHKTIRYFRFCDKTINGDIKALDRFCNLMIEGYRSSLPKITWSGDAVIRPEMKGEFLMKMKKAGCTGLGYGLESGSQRVIEKMGKPFSISLAEEIIRDTCLASIFTSINIMVGFPTETKADFEETLDFIKRNKKNIQEIRLTHVGCRIYFNSSLYNYPERYGLATVDTDYWETEDGLNTYEERVRRFESICQLVLSLGIKLMIGGRLTKKVGLGLLNE